VLLLELCERHPLQLRLHSCAIQAREKESARNTRCGPCCVAAAHGISEGLRLSDRLQLG
jgi:hypothetical protein